jgi:hypothetical protein
MERRLAAILAADVVGYSRLMGADDAGQRRAGGDGGHGYAGRPAGGGPLPGARKPVGRFPAVRGRTTPPPCPC